MERTSRHAEPAAVLWLRRDLRLGDNPALLAALQDGRPLLPVALWPRPTSRRWQPGEAGRWWRWRSLQAMDQQLRRLGSRLVVDDGEPQVALPRIAAEAGANVVVWAAGLDPGEREDDRDAAEALRETGVEAQITPAANLLLEPERLLTSAGRPYTVFTPFWRAVLARVRPPAPLVPPAALPPAPQLPAGVPLEALRDEAARPWGKAFGAVWTPGEDGAHAMLARFLSDALESYAADRDRPDLESSSRRSPPLPWGELTARQVGRAVADRLAAQGAELDVAVGAPARDAEREPGIQRSAGSFLRQVGWREFGHYLLSYFPATPNRPLHEQFAEFPWRDDPDSLAAWQRGLTGVPFVDAAMRQLRATGWMHNRARLVAASFLTKHLLLPWESGEAWFWGTLVDADLANNAMGWQWVAGCGADAAPFFRIMNPATQGRRHDPDGAYVREWVPELRRVPLRHLHGPWLAPPAMLSASGVTLGREYPAPIVDLGDGRSRALAAYDVMRHRNRYLRHDPPQQSG